MRKKHFILIIIVVLIFSLAGCGANKEIEKVEDAVESSTDEAKEVEAEEEEAEDLEEVAKESDDGLLVVGETINKGDRGSGPVKIDSGLTQISIPEGLDYELYSSYVDGNTGTISVDFGMGNNGAGRIEVSTTRMIKSLEDAANECIRTNDFGTMESEIGSEVTHGDLTYKYVTIQKPDGSNTKYFLVAYYKRSDDKDIYVELSTNGADNYYNMDIDNPLIGEVLDALVLK